MSPTDYRAVLGAVPTAVAVVASTEEDTPVGVSVGSFGSVSLEPPLVGFFIARSSTTWPRIERTGGFCASVLAANQQETCRAFATRGVDRFAECEWWRGPTGRPVIAESVAWCDCSIVRVTEAGDHQLVLGQVEAFDMDPDRTPLIFMGGRYGAALVTSDKEGW